MDEEIFFEDIFESLLKESKNFVIDYEHRMIRYKEDEFIEFSVNGVNDTKSVWKFKSKIKELCKEGLAKLTDVIEGSPVEDKINLLEYFSEEFADLRNRVIQKEEAYPEQEGEPAGVHRFLAFARPKFSGSKGDNPHHKSTIEQKAESYANAWLEVINDAKAKIDFLINQIELLPQAKEVFKDKNTIQIFFSWQSDDNDERKLIRKSLTNVIEVFKKAGKTIIIDSDMRNVPGSQDIPNTLFNKIELSDIFVADVNLVFASLHRENTFSPNPNVMIELGYAASKLGWNNIIMLLNTSKRRIEDLPFDIRQRSILWYDKNTPEEITEKLVFAIKQILKS